MNWGFSAAIAFLLAATPAQGAEEKSGGGEACAAVKDATARLSCYDALFAGTASAAPAADPIDRFGAQSVRSKREAREREEVQKIAAAIAAVDTDPFGKLIVTLDNGQVWRQLASDNRVLLSNQEKAKTAEIRRAALGSYKMRIEPLGRTISVRRTL